MVHLIAYCKNHYPRTKDIIKDFRNALVLDGYSFEMSDNDVFEVVKNKFCTLYDTDYLDTLYTELQESNIWKRGYYTKGNCNLIDRKLKTNRFSKYEYRIALLFFIRSYIAFLELSKLPNETATKLKELTKSLKTK